MKTKQDLDRRCRLLLQCSDGSLTVLDRGDTESLETEQEADYRRNLPGIRLPLGYAWTRYRDREMEDPRLERIDRRDGALPTPEDKPFHYPQHVTTPSPLPDGAAVVDPVTIYSVPELTYQATRHLPTVEEAYHARRSGLASGDVGGIISGTVSPKVKMFPGGEERVRTVNGIRGAVSNLIPATAALDVTADLIDAYNDGYIQDAYDLYEWAKEYLKLVPAEAIKFAGVAAAALLGSDIVGFTDYIVPSISPNYPVYDMMDSLVRATDPERKPYHGIRDTMVPVEREVYNQFFDLNPDAEASPLVQSMSSITYNPKDDPITIYKDVGSQVVNNANNFSISNHSKPVQRFDQYTPSSTSGRSNRVYDAGRGNSIITDVALSVPDVSGVADTVSNVGSIVSDAVSGVSTAVNEVVHTAQDRFDTYIWTPFTQGVNAIFDESLSF